MHVDMTLLQSNEGQQSDFYFFDEGCYICKKIFLHVLSFEIFNPQALNIFSYISDQNEGFYCWEIAQCTNINVFNAFL